MARGSSNAPPPSLLYCGKENQQFVCRLCYHRCVLNSGKSGLCGVRTVENEIPASISRGFVTAASLDPIEKKPLFHFLPGEPVWSIGFNGCNFHCPFCQNARIADPLSRLGQYREPEDVIAEALASGASMLAYTYSEPTIHIEFLLDCAELARSEGLQNILVTNGNLLQEPAADLLKLIDGVNVDLKSWDTTYYHNVLGGDRDTVLAFIEIAHSCSWVEVTTLVVPGDNDFPMEIESIADWIAGLSRDIPLHLSGYHPANKYIRNPTPAVQLKELGALASEKLNFVYLGNVGLENSTSCPNCGTEVISRRHYLTSSVLNHGCCPGCGYIIPGVFPG